MHDKALMEKALRGDRAAFEAIVGENQRAIYGFLRARLLQPEDADDLAQEVFLRFYQSRAKFDTSQLIRPWLLGIARNLLREHIRELKRRKEVGWTELCLELDALVSRHDEPHDDALQHLPVCMQELGPSARDAIELRYRKNLGMAAIGGKLRRSEGAVKVLVHRARLALKHCLDGKLGRRKGTEAGTEGRNGADGGQEMRDER